MLSNPRCLIQICTYLFKCRRQNVKGRNLNWSKHQNVFFVLLSGGRKLAQNLTIGLCMKNYVSQATNPIKLLNLGPRCKVSFLKQLVTLVLSKKAQKKEERRLQLGTIYSGGWTHILCCILHLWQEDDVNISVLIFLSYLREVTVWQDESRCWIHVWFGLYHLNET